jgi:hypothetical protein
LPVMSRSRVAVLGAVVAASQRRRPSSSESTERNTPPRTLTALASISSRVIERDLVVGRPCDAPTCGAMGAPRPGVALGVIEKITVMGHSSRHEEGRPGSRSAANWTAFAGSLRITVMPPVKDPERSKRYDAASRLQAIRARQRLSGLNFWLRRKPLAPAKAVSTSEAPKPDSPPKAE